jgi:tetratricopeptide (TPR) repeat protein
VIDSMMKCRSFKAVAMTTLSALLLLYPAMLRPQTSKPKSRIRGTVTDGNGKGLNHIQITLDLNVPSGEQQIHKAASSRDGRFEFDDLAPGTYTVKANCPDCDLPPDITFELEAGHDMGVSLVLDEPGHNAASAKHPAKSTASADQAVASNAGGSLASVGFDQKPAFKAAPYSNPEAGGGYSDSASAGTGQMVQEYLAPQQIGNRTSSATDEGRKIQQLAQAEPTEGHLNRWGNFLLSQRRYPQASSVFGQAVQRYPRSATLRLGLGVALSAAGKYKQAAEQLGAAADLAPSDPEAYLLLGQAAVLERVPDAQATNRLKHFAEIDPGNAQAVYYYAMSLWAESPGATDPGTLRPVESLLRTASTLDPELGQARLELGILYEQEGRTADALRDYQAAEEATPGLAAVHYRLSQVYLRSGDKTSAQKELELYRRANGQTPTAHPN